MIGETKRLLLAHWRYVTPHKLVRVTPRAKPHIVPMKLVQSLERGNRALRTMPWWCR